MKTTIDIPKKDLDEAIRFTKASTKKDAVVTAIKEFNRRKRIERISARAGTFENFMTLEELMELREME